jgi:uncharacterized cofD-like protein
LPSTTGNVTLEAVLEDGGAVQGETNITASCRRIRRLKLVPHDAVPLPQTLQAIAEADLITIGPGSLFTSLVPNLLVHGIPEAIAASAALKVFVCNLMTQANESLGLSVADHIRILHNHAGRNLFDVVVVNSARLSPEVAAKYARQGASQIPPDRKAVEKLGIWPLVGDYLDECEIARHASDRVVQDLMALATLWWQTPRHCFTRQKHATRAGHARRTATSRS